MDRRRVAVALVVAVAIGLVAAEFLQAAAQTAAATRTNACKALQPDPVPIALQNREAPEFELADSTGHKWTLAALRGRPVVLNFWATWCPPCVEEMPSMEELAHKLGDRAVVVAVSVDEDWDAIKRFFAARGTALSVLLDVSKQVPKSYGTEKYPETFLIDPAGHVRYYFINKRNWSQHEAELCIDSVR